MITFCLDSLLAEQISLPLVKNGIDLKLNAGPQEKSYIMTYQGKDVNLDEKEAVIAAAILCNGPVIFYEFRDIFNLSSMDDIKKLELKAFSGKVNSRLGNDCFREFDSHYWLGKLGESTSKVEILGDILYFRQSRKLLTPNGSMRLDSGENLLNYLIDHKAEGIIPRHKIREGLGLSEDALDKSLYRLRQQIEDDPGNPKIIVSYFGSGIGLFYKAPEKIIIEDVKMHFEYSPSTGEFMTSDLEKTKKGTLTGLQKGIFEYLLNKKGEISTNKELINEFYPGLGQEYAFYDLRNVIFNIRRKIELNSRPAILKSIKNSGYFVNYGL